MEKIIIRLSDDCVSCEHDKVALTTLLRGDKGHVGQDRHARHRSSRFYDNGINNAVRSLVLVGTHTRKHIHCS
jgi:hypothetical protein